MDFRSLSICPEQTELIKGYCPVLRKNIVDGRYDGIDQYLDIQFRLLREDFIRPLRERISEFIKTKNKPTAANDKELNVYRNVRISENGTCEFDCTPFKEADWEVIFSFVNLMRLWGFVIVCEPVICKKNHFH